MSALHSLPPLISAIVGAIFTVYLFTYRRNANARMLMALMAALTFWSFGYFREYSAQELNDKLWWATLEYFGVVLVPPLWLFFSINYRPTKTKIRPHDIILVGLIPVLTLVVLWTEQWHHLMWREAWLDLSGPFPMVAYERGPVFWVFVTYSYTLLLAGTIILLHEFLKSLRLYRRQIIIILLGLAAPWLGNILYVFDLSPLPHLDLTPFALTLTGLTLALGLLKYKLLDLTPIAREAVMEHMKDMVIVSDRQNRIVDLNLAARQTFEHGSAGIIGQPLAAVFSWGREFEALELNEISREITLNLESAIRRFSLNSSWLKDREGQPLGRLFLLRDITERHQAESALKESEKKFRELVENIDQLIFTIDTSGQITYVSPACWRILGKTPEEMIGTSFAEHLYPEDLERLTAEFEDVLKNQGHPSQYRVLDSSGGIRWVQSQSKPLLINGEVVGIQGILSDVTWLKQSEEALRESEERYRNLVEESFDGILMHNGHYITFANRRACEILGYEKKELVGLDWSKLSHPSSYELMRTRAMARLRGERPPSRYEVVLQRRDGSAFEAEISAKAITIGGENLIQTWVRDISERKQAEEARLKSEKNYRDLFDSISDFIFTHDVDGRILTANLATCEALGVSRDSISERLLSDFMEPEDQRSLESDYLKSTSTDKRYSGVLSLRNLKGEKLYVELRSSLVEEEGEENHFRCSGRDITGRMSAEKEMKKLQEQLFHAQKMEAVGTLASGIAHDFNNMLQGITGYAQLLTETRDLNERQRRYVEEIEAAVARASDLVTRLLTFGRKMEQNLMAVDLNRKIMETVKILERTIPKMISLNTCLSDGLSLIKADPNQVERVLINLGTNARDAMPEGGRLVIESENVYLDEQYCRRFLDLKPGPYVLLRFSDTGQGMDKDILARIFEPFFTTKGLGQGSGLGLSVVYGIMKAHGGQVNCYSEPGFGTTFNLYFPALDQTEEIEAEPPAQPEPPYLGGEETILLVDDEEAILETARTILEENGYCVLTAESGEEAISLYRQEKGRIDLIILDLNMPGMGGYSCLKEILSLNPEARILISSGYSANGQAKASLESGAKGFIGKPYRLLDMLVRVREVLNEK
ncbi:MAG: PAS domain S-box protein [Thermodesulfobacteriota bacterium]